MVGGPFLRQGKKYAQGKFLRTLMRDFLLVAAALLPVGQSPASLPAVLIPTPGLGLLLATSGGGAGLGAVDVSPVTPTAKKEELMTAHAQEEAERVHGPSESPR